MLAASIITLVLNSIGLLFAWFKQSDKLTDLVYSLSFFVITIYLYLNSSKTITALLLTSMICLWGLRLGGYLFWRINKMKKDTRFDERRVKFTRILNFFLLQIGSIIIIMVPAIIFFWKPNVEMVPIQYVGLAVWAFGFIIESLADFQKSVFKSKSQNKGQFIQSGLWAVVRYPNYTGEIMCWIGVFLFCTPVFITGNWIAIISPLWITILLLFISGIPLLEKSAQEKYGNMPAFQKYVAYSKKIIPGIY